MTIRPDDAAALLRDRTILVIEDETIVAFLLEDMLTSLGCAGVQLAGSVGEALAKLDDVRPDLAVLDVNLGGEFAYPVAERLAALGVPFVFTTGYGEDSVPPNWRQRPMARKPYGFATLIAALRTALATADAPNA